MQEPLGQCIYVPRLPDAVCSADFMSDALGCGQGFCTFNVVDDFNREVLNIEVDMSISSAGLGRIFEQLMDDHRLPQVLRRDKGPEFLGETFIQWAKPNAVAIQYVRLGKPNQNAYIGHHSPTFRDEVLQQHLLFACLGDVHEAAYWWVLGYNEERPHDSLGDLTPAEYRQRFPGNFTFEVPARRGGLRCLPGSSRGTRPSSRPTAGWSVPWTIKQPP